MPNRFSNRRRKIRSVGDIKKLNQRKIPIDDAMSNYYDSISGAYVPGTFPKIKYNVVEPRTDRYNQYCMGVRPGHARWEMCNRIKNFKADLKSKLLNRDLSKTAHPERIRRSKMSLREKQLYYIEKSNENKNSYESQKMSTWGSLDSSHIKSTQQKRGLTRRSAGQEPLKPVDKGDGLRAGCPSDYIMCGSSWFENPFPGRTPGEDIVQGDHMCCHKHDYECRRLYGCQAGSGRGRDR